MQVVAVSVAIVMYFCCFVVIISYAVIQNITQSDNYVSSTDNIGAGEEHPAAHRTYPEPPGAATALPWQ
jgi:hypothetical protein